MKHLKRFNEAIINYESDNVKAFYEELKKLIDASSRFEIPIKDVVKIGEKHDIEVVDYDAFYDQLPENEKKTAPPRRETPVFALINPITDKIRVVYTYIKSLNEMTLDHIYHMMKHENVHIGQISRQKKRPEGKLPDPNDKKLYFSDKMEIMAFAQSISDMLMDENPKSVKDAIKELRFNPLWKDIKKAEVGEEVLNRYKKYIYLYLEKEFEKPEADRKRNKRRMPMGPPPGMGMPGMGMPGMRMPGMGFGPPMSGDSKEIQDKFDDACDRGDMNDIRKFGKMLNDLHRR